MSSEDHKEKHSKRRHKDEVACERQVKIAKAHGVEVEEAHRFAKQHAMDCGQPECVLCGNPRKTMKEKTIQERRFDQKELLE
jgi:hypothetical protein